MAMWEDKDGKFGEPGPLDKILDKTKSMSDSEVAKLRGIHIGSKEELNAIRKQPTGVNFRQIKDKLAQIEFKIDVIMNSLLEDDE